ncbi:MAG: hypothetical protein FJY92_04850 [Candidatus Hydrogenedentes bacterium]|nr:hypothetical protein [Candidatus Hydrogenedentota bacterium]
MAARVRESMKPGDVAGHFSHFTFFPMQEHYLPDVPQVTLGLTGEDRKNMIASYPHEVLWERSGALPVRIDVVAARHDRMWYIESWWEPFDPPPWNVYYRAWLQRHGVIGPDEQFDGVGLTLFDFATMRAAPVRIEQFADAGHVSAAGYIDARGAVVGSPARADWDVHDGFVLRRDPANGNITIMNLSETPRTYRWRYLACAEAIEPLSFNRAEPETDVWRPVIHGDPAFFDDLDPIKMAAALERGGNEVGTLYADVVLPRGTYAMYAYVWNEVGAANASRASLRFRMGNSTANTVDTQSAAIGAVTPWRAQGESGWAWQEIATVESDGARRRLEITAALPDGLERAHADIGRVVFVADGMDANTILAPTTNHVSVAAGGTATISVQPGETAVGRRDVFVEEAETREVRYVNWYVAGP